MSDSRQYPLPVLLSVASGINLVDDFTRVHEAIEYLSGNQVWTHQLPRASKELTPKLIADYPILKTEVPELNGKEQVKAFLRDTGFCDMY